jgi:hypothetical protein
MFFLEMSGEITELKNMKDELKWIKAHLHQPHECLIFNSYINK